MVRVIVALVGGLVCSTALAGADEDPITKKLAAAKADYDLKVGKYQDSVAKWFDKREDTARAAGDKKALDQIKADRTAYDDSGIGFEAAMTLAIKEFTKAKKDDEAAAVEKSLKEFRSTEGVAGVVRRVLLGTWKVAVGNYKGEWTFNDDGSVDSSTSGAKSGKWAIELNKKQVLITWGKDLVDKFELPLDPKATTGWQVGRGNGKITANKAP